MAAVRQLDPAERHRAGQSSQQPAQALGGQAPHLRAPSLACARELLADDAAPAEARLWELCRTDVELLCGGPHNLGGLYLLPEVRSERFAGFHAVRAELKDCYRQLLAATRTGGALAKGELDLRTDLVFGLIEGVILVHRSDPERQVRAFAAATADAALRIAGT